MATWPDSTTLNDLPDVIVSNIIAAVSDVRSRNAASLVCRKWLHLDRSTRTSLTLRGDLLRLPTCFHSATHLDLPLLSSKLDGVALYQGLQTLSIRNVGDLTDMCLIGIGRGCRKLRKFEIQGCEKVSVRGMWSLASLLKGTLVDVKISCCKNLNAAMSLKSLEPIQDRIERLHIDCIWNDDDFDANRSDAAETSDRSDPHPDDSESSISWEKLRCVSLWIGVGEVLSPLASVGLLECPNLEEIRIKVEGDCGVWSRHVPYAFGLSSLVLYPRLSKMYLDCGDTIGYAHTAPPGQMDLSQWERFYLRDIQVLRLTELDYWPPRDRDVNCRSLSLPAAGLLQQCLHLRKLFIHGTAHEHFLYFLLQIPDLRYYRKVVP